MSIFSRLFGNRQKPWSPRALKLLEHAASAQVSDRFICLAMFGKAIAQQPNRFKVYADYSYGALHASIQFCLGNVPGDEGQRLVQDFVQGFKNDLLRLNGDWALKWLAAYYAEPEPDSPRLSAVAYVGYAEMLLQLAGKADPKNQPLLALVADIPEPLKFENTLLELLEKHRHVH